MTPPADIAHPAERARIARALDLIGITVQRWRNDTTIDTKDRDARSRIDIAAVLDRVTSTGQTHAKRAPEDLAAELAVALDRPIPDALLDTPQRVEHLLRPRLIPHEQLTGLNKAAVRRDAFNGLIDTVAIGHNPNARLVRTRELDAWNADFDDVFQTAIERLRQHITPQHAHLVEDTRALYAVVHEREPTAAAHRILHDLIPGHDAEHGALFALPSQRTLLALPVRPDVGPTGLAGIIQSAHVLADPDDPRLGIVYWALGTDVHTLPMTREDAEDGNTRVVLQQTDITADLLNRLGDDPDHQHRT